MNDINTVSDKLNFILYADDTTLTSPLCSFTNGAHNVVSHISSHVNSELLKISDWLQSINCLLMLKRLNSWSFTIIKE